MSVPWRNDQRPATALRKRHATAQPHRPGGSLDLAAFHDDGTVYVIWPRVDCGPWHAEVIAREDGYVFVREWHAIGCLQFQAATANPERELQAWS
jgi:hypothetical protein